MKRNIFAVVCAAVIAGAAFVPMGLQNMPQPGASAVVTAASQNDNASPNARGADAAQAAPEPAAAANGSQSEPAFEQGTVMAELADGVTVEQLNGRLASLDCIATKSVSEDDIVFGYVKLQLADGVSVDDAEAQLRGEDMIESAQPNYIYHLADVDNIAAQTAGANASQGASSLASGLVAQITSINDPDAGKQWGLDAVKAYDAWDTAKAEDANPAVTVAVLDTGIKTDHEDFDTSRIVGRYSPINEQEYNRPQIVSDASESGHGTHVAGIIAATTDNGKGIAGVSYNANVMPVQVLDASGKTDTGIVAKGLRHVVENASAYNVRVVNLSLGTDTEATIDGTLQNAIEAVHNAGLLIVYSSGNGGESGPYNCSPCDYDDDEGAIGVISVSQNGSTYRRSTFSNYNKEGQHTKDLCAPGNKIYSTNNDGGYSETSGTSMAAPFVSGIAALMFANDPSLTPAQVRNALCNTAQDLNTQGWDAETGYGLVDAKAALTGATSEPRSLGEAAVTLSDYSYTYNGKPCKPTATVKINGTTLKAGTDYTITYSDNVDAGTATATIRGANSYSGSVSESFTINKAKLDSMKLSVAKYAYDGTSKSPTVTVRGAKNGKEGQILTRNTNYTLTIPSGRAKVGTYTYKATGKGNYTGTVKATLTITKAANTMKVSTSTKSTTVKKLKKASQKVRPITVSNARGTKSFKKKSGSKYLTVNTKNGAVTVAKGTRQGTYTAKVAVKAAGNSSYKSMTKTVKITVKVKK